MAWLLLPAAWRRPSATAEGRAHRVGRFALIVWLVGGIAGSVVGSFWQANLWAWTTFWLPILLGLGAGLRRRL